jgi:hypothetical protein
VNISSFFEQGKGPFTNIKLEQVQVNIIFFKPSKGPFGTFFGNIKFEPAQVALDLQLLLKVGLVLRVDVVDDRLEGILLVHLKQKQIGIPSTFNS